MPNDTIEAALLSSLRDALYWAPEWASSAALLVLAALLALVVHRIIVIALRRAFGERHPTCARCFVGPTDRWPWR